MHGLQKLLVMLYSHCNPWVTAIVHTCTHDTHTHSLIYRIPPVLSFFIKKDLCIIIVVWIDFVSICMLLHPPGVLYFLIKHYVDRYNIYYVYKPAPFQGRQFIHRSAINFVIVGAVHLQLFTLFFSIVRLGWFLYLWRNVLNFPCTCTFLNESTAGADALVEMPKLHNMKLLIAYI